MGRDQYVLRLAEEVVTVGLGRHRLTGMAAGEGSMAADGLGAGLTSDEMTLCEFHDLRLAECRRDEVRAHYAVAQRVRDHRMATVDGLRESFERCGRRIGRDRTTLIRYATVAQRIKPDELESLLTLSDRRGFSITFWDLVEVAGLGLAERRTELARRLDERRYERSSRPPAGRAASI